MGWVEDNTNKDPIAKVGMRIRMLSMEDEFPVDEGMEGTIYNIDDLGTLHVKWDDGRNLGIIPGIDEYQVLPSEDEQIDLEFFNEDKGAERILKNAKSGKLTKNLNHTIQQTNSKYKIKETESDHICCPLAPPTQQATSPTSSH